jgi:hypothetical protein
MTSYKNFTSAMSDTHGVALNVHQIRNGYAARDDGSLMAFSAKKVSTVDGRIAEQFFNADGTEFVSVVRNKNPGKTEQLAFETAQPVGIYIGGDFTEEITETKRVRNPNGPGWFRQAVTKIKTSAGVQFAGNFQLSEIKQSADSYTLVYTKI